jgi:hypothetical protein
MSLFKSGVPGLDVEVLHSPTIVENIDGQPSYTSNVDRRAVACRRHVLGTRTYTR